MLEFVRVILFPRRASRFSSPARGKETVDSVQEKVEEEGREGGSVKKRRNTDDARYEKCSLVPRPFVSIDS